MPIFFNNNVNQNENEIILNEQRITNGGNLSIMMDGDGKTFRGWGLNPYFKVIKNDGGKYVSRILVFKTFYVYPEHNGGEGKVYYLNKSEIEKVAELLEAPGIWDKLLNIIKLFVSQYPNQYKRLGIFENDINIKNYPLLNYRNLPDKNTAKSYGSRWTKMSDEEREKILSQY